MTCFFTAGNNTAVHLVLMPVRLVKLQKLNRPNKSKIDSESTLNSKKN